MLEMQSIGKRFRGPDGEVSALVDVNVSVTAGEVVAVRGASGCGKTTLLLTAGALLRPSTGTVRLLKQDVYGLSNAGRNALRAQSIGFVFQQFHLIPYLSVRENILAPSLVCPRPDAPRRAEELIERFGLGSRRNHHPSQLSTGERQRTALARALLNRPKLILADEPTGNLDELSGKEVLDSLAEFAQRGGAVMIVTHDSAAAAAADRAIRMADGALVEN